LLVLVRHGQSEWNLTNTFTGTTDVALTDLGRAEARRAGRILAERKLKFGVAFTSALRRAHETLALMQVELGVPDLPVIKDAALDERAYGELTGINKDEARKRWGEDQIKIWRRSYDVAPPGGESLRDAGARVWPYYIHTILPRVLGGEGVLVSAHGNSLRALIMALEGLAPDQIVDRELETGVPIIYWLRDDSTIADREIVDVEAAA
jgi:2,3-bisphosphoglycerate-dependent phosphoglycerate mutase